MERQAGHVRVRVVGLITREDTVLVITQSNSQEHWKCFPGGQLEHGEMMEECLSRELSEELSLDVKVGALVACGTYEEGSTTSLEMYFHCVPITAEPKINEAHILAAEYLPVAKLPENQTYPIELARDLAELLADTKRGVTYYGRFS